MKMKLNYKRTIFVGFAFFLISLFWQAYDTIIPKILTDKFGMNQSWSGVIMAVDNVLALFLLPLFGNLSDKCKSKSGRRTPFIKIGTILAVCFLLLLTFADTLQLKQLSAVAPTEPAAQEILYDADLTFRTPDGEEIVLQDKFSKTEYTAITMFDENGKTTEAYTDYVVPARQAYAAALTAANQTPLIVFVALLFCLLLSMSTFRSPAVALMPDVTIKPLRSKGNAVINLMGALGGITVLVLGMVFGTGKAQNALMSYGSFFACIGALMLIALLLFLWQVKEPQFVKDMEEESARLGLDTAPDTPEEEAGFTKAELAEKSGKEKMPKEKLVSLLLILASVVLWYLGYNAVTSKYSVYASSVLNLDYNMTLTIASAAAIVSYLPVGFIASKVGRRKTILAGVLMLGAAFGAASFMRAGSSALVMNALFVLAGMGWATINVNSYPMVVELCQGDQMGKYTGFYYTASMAAQTLTPVLSGILMDKLGMTVLFPYGSLFVLAAFATMFFVKHGDNKPTA